MVSVTKRAFLVALVGLLLGSATARAETATFEIQSLKVDLRAKYNTAGNRARLEGTLRVEIAKMKRCFVSVVKENPKYDGFLWIAMTIAKNGTVSQHNLTTTVQHPVAAQCLDWMVKYMKVPRGLVGKANAQVHVKAH
jgi:hypothetical protein